MYGPGTPLVPAVGFWVDLTHSELGLVIAGGRG